MIQIQFIHFPGYEPLHIERDWRHLPTPYRTMSDEAVFDLAGANDDPIMELVDWAIDNHPAVFGVASDDGDYEAANDLSVSLAGEIAFLAEDVIDDKGCVRGDGGIWSERYRDASLTDGVVVRIAYFARGPVATEETPA